MMKTDDLLVLLSMDTETLEKPLALGQVITHLVIGLAVSLSIVFAYGIRDDLNLTIFETIFKVKESFALSTAIFSIYCFYKILRPGVPLGRESLAIVLIFAILWIAGIKEYTQAVDTDKLTMVLGVSWKSCPWNILLISFPLMASLVALSKKFAPVNLRATGGYIGLASGALATSVYALHCPESSLVFVAIWYAMGVLLAALLGYLLAPRFLKW